MDEHTGGEGGTFGTSSEPRDPDDEAAEAEVTEVVAIPIGVPLTAEELRRLKAAAEEAAPADTAQEDPDTG